MSNATYRPDSPPLAVRDDRVRVAAMMPKEQATIDDDLTLGEVISDWLERHEGYDALVRSACGCGGPRGCLLFEHCSGDVPMDCVSGHYVPDAEGYHYDAGQHSCPCFSAPDIEWLAFNRHGYDIPSDVFVDEVRAHIELGVQRRPSRLLVRRFLAKAWVEAAEWAMSGPEGQGE